MTSRNTGPTDASDMVTPGVSALVESDSSRSTPTLANLVSASVIHKTSVDGSLVQLEVARVHDVGHGGADEDSHSVRYGVVHGEEVEPIRRNRPYKDGRISPSF